MTATALALAALLTAAPAAADEHPVLAAVKPRLKHPDRPFSMYVKFEVKPGSADAFEAAFLKAIKATRREKGNQAYHLHRGTENPNVYALYERWKDLDALREHVKAAHVEELLKAVEPILAGPPKILVGIPVGD